MSQQNTGAERVSDRLKVLSDRSGDLKIMGVTPQMVVGMLFSALIVYFYEQVLGYSASILVYLLCIGVIGLCWAAGKHSPGHLPIYIHVYRWVNHRLRQHTMLNARLGSKKEQPRNDGILGWIMSQPQMDELPLINRQGTERAQDIVQVSRPFANSPAIERVDGAVIGALKIRPAAMAVADENNWDARVRRFADVIDSSVKGRVSLNSQMRAVDYGDRSATYAAREQQFLSALANKHGSIDDAYEAAENGNIDNEDIALLVSADLAEERQDVIDLYDTTTLTREYYVIVEVSVRDIVSGTTHRGDGGFDNVPLLGDALHHYREHKLAQEGDYTHIMIERLEDRLGTLRRDLSTIDGVKAHTMSSTEFSQVLADHYQAGNVYANRGFKDLIRLSPTPVSSDGSSLYGVRHNYIDDIDPSYVRGGSDGDGTESESDTSPIAETRTGAAETAGVSDRLDVPQRETTLMGTSEDDDPEPTTVRSRLTAPFARRASEANNDPISDVILSDVHLADHYQTVIGPKDIYRGESGWLGIDKAAYSKTLSIRGWPNVPKMGILEPILREYEPGVAVNLTTHINPTDQAAIRKELADEQNTRETSLKSMASSRLPRVTQSHEEDVDEIDEMIEANKDSEYDVFKCNTHIELRSDDPEALARAFEHIEAAMNDEGAMVREETEYHYEGLQSVAPACDDKLEEPIPMFADGVARQFPWTSRNLHEPNGVEFGVNMHTEEPIYLDLWNRNSGFDFGIFTKKGGGKTTTATEILGRINSVYQDDVMTIIIDPLQEYANLATVHGGTRIVIGGDAGINPFHIEETPPEKLSTIGRGAPYKHWAEKCMDFVEMYYVEEGINLAEKKGVWRMAIREAAERHGITPDPQTHSPEWRIENGYSGDCPTPLDVIEIIDEIAENPEEWVRSPPDSDPAQRKIEEREKTAVHIINDDVQPFEEGGEYEHFTRQTDIDIDDSTLFYIDMQQQEASTSIGLTMQVVYDLFYEKVKTIDIPSIIFMDEFHYMLRDSIAQKSLNQKFRHGRHWDLSLGVATQSFKDFFGEDDEGKTHLTDNAQVLFEGMPTRIYHREEVEERWMEPLGLNADEIKFIRNAEPGNRELGYSTALLHVEDKGTYPMKVKMDFNENPREAIVTEYDPGKHGEDMLEYLLKHDNIAKWRFAPEDGLSTARTLGEHSNNTPDEADKEIVGAEQNQGPDISAITAEAVFSPGGDD